ncbi:serine/threonine-protein phosphatase [Leucobacter sp. OH2974_COT-288]|nr:serine/threonine-protein phosphatase [Leucobacter sp. OH2974_COT-288]
MSYRLPQLKYAARTDIGSYRQVNEDAMLCAGPVFLVADGVGGHDVGEIAAAAAIDAFTHLTQHPYVSLDAVGAAYAHARAAVNRISGTTEQGAGTTLTGIFLTRQEQGFAWLIINVGDSRVYRFRDGKLQQITVDHTLRNEMLASGVALDDPRLPAGNVITRALGSGADTLDTWLLPLTAGERLLVCSDGLTDTLSDAEIAAGLALAVTETSANYLLDTALEKLPRDNVTLLLVDVLDAGQHQQLQPGVATAEKFIDDCDTADLTATVQQTAEYGKSL